MPVDHRKPHARAMIKLAKFIGVSMTQGGKAGDLLRKAIAPRLHWIPGLRDRLLDGETPPLRRTGLVEGLGLRKSLNGRLCPNALLADGTRYDDVTRGGFVFVTGVPLSLQQRAVLTDRGTEVLEAEPGSPLYKWLAEGHATAALVRPDFTVVRAGRGGIHDRVGVRYRRAGDSDWREGMPLLRLFGEQLLGTYGAYDYVVPNLFAGSIIDPRDCGGNGLTRRATRSMSSYWAYFWTIVSTGTCCR